MEEILFSKNEFLLADPQYGTSRYRVDHNPEIFVAGFKGKHQKAREIDQMERLIQLLPKEHLAKFTELCGVHPYSSADLRGTSEREQQGRVPGRRVTHSDGLDEGDQADFDSEQDRTNKELADSEGEQLVSLAKQLIKECEQVVQDSESVSGEEEQHDLDGDEIVPGANEAAINNEEENSADELGNEDTLVESGEKFESTNATTLGEALIFLSNFSI